jgi:hypothetical protein
VVWPRLRVSRTFALDFFQFHDLALYRLYILKSGDMESDNGAAASSSQMMPKGYDPCALSTSVAPCPPLQPWGVFTGNKALAAGTSTSQYMLPPPPPQQQQQQQLHSAQHAHYYHHQQHAFVRAATAAGAAQPHARNTPVLGAAPPHARHMPVLSPAQSHAHNMPNMPVLGAGLPSSNLLQFAVPPAPVPVPVPPAAAHQAPAAVAMLGAGQDASQFGTKSSPPSSPSAIEISPAEQQATATEEPPQAQFGDSVKPTEAVTPPPSLDDILASPVKDEGGAGVAGDYNGIGMPDWNSFDFTPFDDSFPNLEFTFEELLGGDSLAMEADDNNSGEENYGQAGAAQQEPPAALSCY